MHIIDNLYCKKLSQIPQHSDKRLTESRTVSPKVIYGGLVDHIKCLLFMDAILLASALKQFYETTSSITFVALRP